MNKVATRLYDVAGGSAVMGLAMKAVDYFIPGSPVVQSIGVVSVLVMLACLIVAGSIAIIGWAGKRP